MKDFCIILMFDKKFLRKSYETIRQIREIGLYTGDIVCIISNNLKTSLHLLYKDDNIIIKYFKEVNRSKIVNDPKKDTPLYKSCFPMWQKMIHYHKFYCFHTWFRDNYKRCLYIDTGTQIFKPLNKIIELDCTDKFLAHSNAYPDYEETLSCQFDKVLYPELYEELNNLLNLNVDHFQATIFMFDTSLIEDYTFEMLIKLANHYINSKTNDQAILNLYFNCLLGKWKQIQIKDDETYFYDFWERGNLTRNDYIMLKYPKT